MSVPAVSQAKNLPNPLPQADIQGGGVKFNADGKMWVSTKGSSRFLYQATKCLESGYLYSIHFDYSGFDMLMERAGIPAEERKEFIRNLEVDDEVGVYPSKIYG
jgi:hypothetical protein